MHKEIRVLRIITRLNIGGPSVHVAYLSQFLNSNSQYRFKTLLISGKTHPSEGEYSLFSDKNFEYIYLPSLQRELHPLKDFIAFFHIIKIIYKFKPHIVHTHQAKAGLLGRVAALLMHVPVRVHTFHGHTFHSYFSKWKSKFFLSIERFLSKKSHIIVISPHQKGEIESYLENPPSLSLVRLGLPLKSLSQFSRTPTLRKELNIEDGSVLAGWIGRLVPIKNVFMFLETAKKIVSFYNKVHFIIIGDGELRPQVEKWITEEKLGDKIHLLGFRSDLSNIYHSLDIVTLTSFNEGTPVSLLEASACGKPVLATKVGGIEDIIIHNKTGYLVDVHNTQEFSDSLLKMVQDSQLRKQFGDEGQKRILEAYDINRLIQDIQSLYKDLITATALSLPTSF